jgi:hypothetical protein
MSKERPDISLVREIYRAKPIEDFGRMGLSGLCAIHTSTNK